MALAKRTILTVVLGVVLLVAAAGGGIFIGLKYFSSPPEITTSEVPIPNPGPMLDMGQFTSTMADPETHVVKVKVTVELSGPEVETKLADPGWMPRIKDEILLTLKDQKYDSVRYAEGMERLKQDMKARLNAMLPRVNGKVAVNRVLFDEFMTQ